MNRSTLMKCAAGALAIGMAPAAFAQATCDDMNWMDAVLDIYPDIDDACDEVIIGENGVMYGKIDATFHRMTRAGDVIVYVQENDGDSDPVRFEPPEGTTVNIDGVEREWNSLYDGQDLRFYVPGDRFVLLTDVEEAEPMVAVVHVEETEPAEPVQAEVTYTSDDDEDIRMPTTANNHGIWLLAGLMMLLGGGGLLARQRS